MVRSIFTVYAHIKSTHLNLITNVNSATCGIFYNTVLHLQANMLCIMFKLGIITGDDYDHCSCSIF